jgi:hypothetical protein
MGFESRSMSLTRYRVRGEVEGNFWEAVAAGVKQGAYRTAQTPGELVGEGFVSQSDFTECRSPGIHAVYGNYVVLGFRIDRARISSRILEMELRDQTKKQLEISGQQRLSSAQHRELKQTIKEKLYSQPFPAVSIQVHDLVWDTAEGLLYFTSTSQKAREELERWFKHCFGLTLTPLIPYLRAEELAGKSIAATLENTCFMNVLQEHAELGRDFLKWLWFKTETDPAKLFELKPPLLVTDLNRVTLALADVAEKQTVTVNGEQSQLREGIAALREGKQVESMRFWIRSQDEDYSLTLNAAWFTCNGLRTPVQLPDPQADETEDGELLEKIALVEKAWSLVDDLFAAFMKIRTSNDWARTELPAMEKWIEEAA